MNIFGNKDEEPKPALAPERAGGPAAAAGDDIDIEDGGAAGGLGEPSVFITEADRDAHETRESGGGRFDRGNRYESFQMAPIEMAPQEEAGDSKQRLSQMFAQSVIDEEAIQQRLEGFKAEARKALVSAITKSARFDPESYLYQGFLVFIIVLSAYSCSAAGYYIGFEKSFMMFHAGNVIAWVRDCVPRARLPARAKRPRKEHVHVRQRAPATWA